MSTNELESVVIQAQRLSPKEQLILIKRVADSLAEGNLANIADELEEKTDTPKHLIYGEFHDAPGHMSTEDDFRLAEWHPTEKDLNGE
jgi:hypothetical protein